MMHRLDDVGAAAERAVDHDLGAALHGVDDLRQHMHRAAAVIELAAAMVRNVNPVDAVIDASAASSAVAMPLTTSGILYLSLISFTVRHSSPFWKSPPVARSRLSRT